MKRKAVLLLVFLFAAPYGQFAQGQAFIPTASSNGGISLWEDVQTGVTLTGAKSQSSTLGGASALYLGRYIQSAYVGPTIRVNQGTIRFDLLTTVGVSRTSSELSAGLPELPRKNVYSLSSMVGLTLQDGTRSILIGLAYSTGYEPVRGEHRPHLTHHEFAQQRRLVLGLGWSL